jgi:hypothetical protein
MTPEKLARGAAGGLGAALGYVGGRDGPQRPVRASAGVLAPYRQAAGAAAMQRSRSGTHCGVAVSPAAQRRTDRGSMPARRAKPLWLMPRAASAARKASGVMAGIRGGNGAVGAGHRSVSCAWGGGGGLGPQKAAPRGAFRQPDRIPHLSAVDERDAPSALDGGSHFAGLAFACHGQRPPPLTSGAAAHIENHGVGSAGHEGLRRAAGGIALADAPYIGRAALGRKSLFRAACDFSAANDNRWFAGKVAPKVYGDKQQHEHGTADGKPLLIQVVTGVRRDED